MVSIDRPERNRKKIWGRRATAAVSTLKSRLVCNHHFILSSSIRKRFYPQLNRLDKPWSQVPPLLPPGTCSHVIVQRGSALPRPVDVHHYDITFCSSSHTVASQVALYCDVANKATPRVLQLKSRHGKPQLGQASPTWIRPSLSIPVTGGALVRI